MPAIESPTAARPPPQILGLHHLRIPVTDALVSRDWYLTVLGFSPVLIVEEEDALVGVVVEHASGVSIGLHQDGVRAESLRGFVVVSFAVPDLDAWTEHLERQKVQHRGVQDANIGRSIEIADPDGILISLHTPQQPSVDGA